MYIYVYKCVYYTIYNTHIDNIHTFCNKVQSAQNCTYSNIFFLYHFFFFSNFYYFFLFSQMRRIAQFRKDYNSILDNLMPEDERVAFCDNDVVNVLTNRDQLGRRVLIVNAGGKGQKF